MPYVLMQITREGATIEQKEALIKGVTDLLVRVLNKKTGSNIRRDRRSRDRQLGRRRGDCDEIQTTAAMTADIDEDRIQTRRVPEEK